MKGLKLIVGIILLVCLLACSSKSIQAAYFYLEPQSKDLGPDESFDINLRLNTEDKEVSGTDVIFSFNSSYLKIDHVGFSNHFSKTDASINNDNGEIRLFFTKDSPSSYFKGNEIVATILAQSQNPGRARLSFICTDNVTANDSNVWEKSGSDIINCGALTNGIYDIREAICDIPAIPDNIKAVSGPNTGEITLTWDKSERADYYRIAYGQSSKNYEYGALNIGNTDSYVVKNLSSGKNYYFILLAVNNCGTSGARYEVVAVAGNVSNIGDEGNKQEFYYPPEENELEWEDELEREDEASPSATPTLKPLPTVQLFPEGDKENTNGEKSFTSWLKWIIVGPILLLVMLFVMTRLLGGSKKNNHKDEKSGSVNLLPKEPDIPSGPPDMPAV